MDSALPDFSGVEAHSTISVLRKVLDDLEIKLDLVLQSQTHSKVLFDNNAAPVGGILNQLNVVLVIKDIIKSFDVQDFTYGDVVRQRSQKVTQILENLKDFVQFKKDKEEIFISRASEILELQKRVCEMGEKCERLDRDIVAKTNEVNVLEVQSQQKKHTIFELEALVASLHTSTESRTKVLQALKTQIEELSNQQTLVKNGIKELQNTAHFLSKSVVKSPLKIISEAEDCQKSLNYLSRQHVEASRKHDEAVAEKSSVEKAIERTKASLVTVNSLIQDVDKFLELRSRINDLEERNNELKDGIKKEKFDIKFYSERLEVKLEATKQLEVNMERKRDEAKKRLVHLQTTKESSLNEIRELQRVYQELQKRKEHLEREFTRPDSGEDHDANRFEYLCQVSELVEQLNCVVKCKN